MWIYRPTYQQITVDEWNEWAKVYNLNKKLFNRYNCLYEERKENPNYKPGKPYQFFFKEKTTKAYITIKMLKEWYNFVIDLNNKKIYNQPISNLYRQMTRTIKIKSMSEDKNIYSSELDEKGFKKCFVKVTPAFRFRIKAKYTGHAFGYDINKAYLNAMLNMKKVIDLANPVYKKYSRVGTNEVGFDFDGNVFYEKGAYCPFVFKLIKNDSSILRYANKIIKELSNASEEEKPFVKLKYQATLGNLKHHNVFFYNMIIDYCNQQMSTLLTKKIENGIILSATTDGFISKEKLDLPLSDKVGDFKLEHNSKVTVLSNGYQWENELPKVTGFSSAKVELYNEISKIKFDFSRDYEFVQKLPNIYRFDLDLFLVSNRKIYERSIDLYEKTKNLS